MKSTAIDLNLPTGPRGDLTASDKHCVFRSGDLWFSVPAVAVREISVAPVMVPVPNCHPSLAGLCHLRSEFIPVLRLNTLLDADAGKAAFPHNRLLVINGHSAWALLIAEAAALENLETLVTPEARTDEAHLNAVLGTSMFRNHIVRVLDPTRLFRLAQQALEETWQRPQTTVQLSRCNTGSKP